MHRKIAIGIAIFLCAGAYLIHAFGFEQRTILFDLIIIFFISIDLGSVTSGILRRLSVVVGALAFGLCVIEGLALSLEPKPPIAIQSEGLVVHRDVLGWGPAGPGAYHSARIDAKAKQTIYDVTYTFDENLLRATISGNGQTIAFFGDSYTLGEGVNDAETMPQAFADETGRTFRIINFGFSAYSSQQFLRAMETGLFDKVIGANPRLFVFLTSPWQDDRVACKAKYVAEAPRYILADGAIKFCGICGESQRFRVIARRRRRGNRSVVFEMSITIIQGDDNCWATINRGNVPRFRRSCCPAKYKRGYRTLYKNNT
jgi:ABC-type thiamin/hydroxymethylpyrimidine transport system permease subunit